MNHQILSLTSKMRFNPSINIKFFLC